MMSKFAKLLVVAGAAMALCCAPVVSFAEEAGFEEFPVGPEEDSEKDVADLVHVAAVYFQPVEMEPAEAAGLSYEEANMHIEADISSISDALGFGIGDWVPYLTVDYEIYNQETGELDQDGTFMPMSASDGPHYGANILLENAGTYTLKFIIHSPVENDYLLHVDEETGVSGTWDDWSEPLEVEFTDWEWDGQDLK